MNLLPIINPINNEPITPSKDVSLKKVVRDIKHITENCYRDLVEVQNEGINALWEDKNLSPQEIIDGLGDDAIKIFQFHGKLTDFIIELSEIDGVEYNPALPTKPFTVADGKITVSME